MRQRALFNRNALEKERLALLGQVTHLNSVSAPEIVHLRPVLAY